MYANIIKIIFLCLLAFALNISFAHNNGDSIPRKRVNIDSILNKVDTRVDQLNKDTAMEHLVQFSREDSTLKKALGEYNLFGLAHRQRALQWNLTSSIIIFWSVIFLVFSGIFFAGVQFYIAMQFARKRGSMQNEDLNTQLEAGEKGVKVSSPVLGVIILVISMLFFYLYLKYVYPITEIF